MSTDYQGSPATSSSQGIMVNPVEAQQIRPASSRENYFRETNNLSATTVEPWLDGIQGSTLESDSSLPSSESNSIRSMGISNSQDFPHSYNVNRSASASTHMDQTPESSVDSAIADSELTTSPQPDEVDTHVPNEAESKGDSILALLKKLAGPSRLEDINQAKELLQLINVDTGNDVRLGVLEVVQRTRSLEILDSIANSHKFCACCYKWLSSALEDQSWSFLEKTLKTLAHLPMQLKKVRKYNLGIAVRRTKDKAKANNKAEIQHLADKLIEIWKEMQTEAPTDTSAASPTGSESSKKNIKLALQKDPPARAKAITNKDFFTSLTSSTKPKSSYVIRPSSSATNNLSIDRILDQWKKPAPVRVASPNQPPPLEYESGKNSDMAVSVLKKRVRFEADHKLVQIREYERDPDEWKPHIPEPVSAWRVPSLIALSAEDRKHQQVDTYEVQVQRAREMREPPVVYPTRMQIPPSPVEPTILEESDPSMAVIIPLQDTTLLEDEVGNQDPAEQIPYSPQAITYSPPEPEKTRLQPTWTQPEPAPTPPLHTNNPVTTAPPAGGNPSLAQVTEMLMNNPEIMQMAMQMLNTQQPVPAQEHYQIPTPPPPPTSRENSDRYYSTLQWETPSGYSEASSGGGGAIRGHGESRTTATATDHRHFPYSRHNKQKAHGRKKGKPLCRYYTSSHGCRYGEECSFIHDRG